MQLASFPPRRVPAPRLQIFVSDLSATGVVRNALAIANQAAASGYDVHLLTCTANGVLAGQVDPRVTIVELLDGPNRSAPRRAQLKQVFRSYRGHSRAWRPDILFSAGNHGHLLSTFAWLGLPGAKVLRISNDLRHGTPSSPARLWRSLKFQAMTMLSDRLVVVSREHGGHPLLCRLVAKGKALVIPNGVDVQAVRNASLEPCPHPWASDRDVPIVLAIGRHVKQKNFAFLLRAFAAARRQRPMRLIILGQGEAKESVRLHNLAVGLGVAADVSFVPTTANPFPYMAAAHALALPSLWEGSSNVLLEALACRTPIIASRTAGDAEQLLSRGRFGVLIDPKDEEGLAAALLEQVGPDAIYPGSRALAFNRAVVLEDYMRLFRQCVGRRQRAIRTAEIDQPTDTIVRNTTAIAGQR
jgi:glycosyltransferase involved in cell wall biosynthesis